jgi:hypothetical protein
LEWLRVGCRPLAGAVDRALQIYIKPQATEAEKMSKVLDLLSPEDLALNRISRFSINEPILDRLKAGKRHRSEICRTGELMALAAIDFAEGKSVERVLKDFQAAAKEWKSVLPKLDFRPTEFEEWVDKETAAELSKAYGATLEPKRKVFLVRYIAPAQPLFNEFATQGLVCAVVSGDRALAEGLAKRYTVSERHGFLPHTALCHLLAGDDRRAKATCKRLRYNNDRDFPPCLPEFPVAVATRDSQLLATGLKKIKSIFSSHWDRGKWTAKKDWCIERWILSLDTIAFLNVASWRGMQLPSDSANLFSEWVPQSLCQI